MRLMESTAPLASLGVLLLLSGCGTTMRTSSTEPAPMVVGVGMQTNGVATNRAIDVQFSTAMDPATINNQTFLLSKASDGTGVPGTVAYDGTNFVASFKPSAAMQVNSTYNATITTGVADTVGDHLAANYAFSFNTRGSSDSSPIKVYETIPGMGQTGVPVATTVQVVFTEGAASSTVNVNTFVVKDGNGQRVGGTVTYDIVTNYATFKPAAPLVPGMTYTVTISGVTDLAGVMMASPYTFSFTTAGGTGAGQDLVYETDQVEGSISGWVFDSTAGTLKQTPGSPYPSGLQPFQMIVSPDRKTLYVIQGNQPPGERGSNCFNFNTQVISYAIDHSSGALTPVPEQQITLNGFCAATSAAIDPMGHYLYVGQFNGDGSSGLIDVLGLSAGGKMTPVAEAPSPQVPTWLVVDGNYIFAANSVGFETEGILTFQRDPSTGAVKFMSGTTMAPQQSVAASVSGGTLYSVGSSTGLVSEFQVNAVTGALVAQGTVKTGSPASQIVTDPTGKYAAVAADNGVDLYDVGPTGGLTAAAGSPFGGSAGSVMFDSTASYFVAQQGTQVQVYGLGGTGVKAVASTQGTGNPAMVTIVTK